MRPQPAIIRRKRSDTNLEVLQKVSEILSSIHYGSITLIIQGGTVFQIDKTESHLFEQPTRNNPTHHAKEYTNVQEEV